MLSKRGKSWVVQLSSAWAVSGSSPMVRAVNVASLAVVVLHEACAVWVVRPWSCRCCSRVVALVRLSTRRWASGVRGVSMCGVSLSGGWRGIGSVEVLRTVGRRVRRSPWW